MRLFLALWPDDNVRLALASQRLEVARLTGGRPTMPVTMHLTLVFAGNIPAGRLLELKLVVAGVRAPSFEYVIDSAGCFGGPRVAWLAGATPPKALLELQSSLQRAIANADFDVDIRAFRPHITVTRDIQNTIETRRVTPTSWPINHFDLIHAQPAGHAVHYETLERWNLTG